MERIGDQAALLQAIRVAPDDDLPRLVYADWLEEHDQAQYAEFIRAQCALARLPECDPERPVLTRRAAELLKWHGYRFLQLDHPQVVRGMTFDRGFVEQIQIPARQLLDASWLPLAPTLHTAVLDDVTADQVWALTRFRWPDWLTVLEFRAALEEDEFPDWASIPREVERVRDTEAELLVSLARLERLQSFGLAYFVITDGARQKLSEGFGDRLRLYQSHLPRSGPEGS